MKRNLLPKPLCRVMALMLVVLLFVPTIAWSMGQEPLIAITLQWSNGESTWTAEASPISYEGYENSWWLFIPADALGMNPLITVENISGDYAKFSIPSGSSLPVFDDAGDSLNGMALEILAYDQNDQQAAVFRLYISTIAEQPVMPEATAAPVSPVEVTVYFRTQDGVDIASSQRIVCMEGETTIAAQPFDLKPGYMLMNGGTQTVYVDANGADRTEVVFLYNMPVIEPVNITVYYQGEDGNDIAPPQTKTCTEGTNAITAAPDVLPEGFTLDGENVQYVIVDAAGATPQSIVFRYSYTQTVTEPPVTAAPTDTPKPAPITVFVSVYYRDMDGNTLWTGNTACVEGEPNAITADLMNLPGGYTLNGEGIQYVSVDASGNATPGEVVFLFTAPDIVPITAEIMVRYLNESQEDIADFQYFTCNIGNNIISARPDNLPAGYTLISDPMQAVTLSPDNVLSASEVLFYYTKTEATEPVSATTAPPAATGTPVPEYNLTPMDAYCYPTKDGINFRSSPTTQEDNILGVLDRTSLGQITGKLNNSNGELWYAVTVEAVSGYMKDTVVRVLTQEELDAELNPVPTPTPMPAPEVTPLPTVTEMPTEIPDGIAIDLWAHVSDTSVRFRSSPEITSKNLLKTLNNGQKAWIFSSVTVDSEKWYAARVDGKDGYMMAEFMSLYSQQESDLYQSQLPSPMPLQTPGFTQLPTATATPLLLTETPSLPPAATGTPGPTSSPAPYAGYAVTIGQAALRTGISLTDETILATLPSQTLVYLWSQVYVEGSTWNFADALGMSGYLPDNILRRITKEEADYYKQLQEPTTAPQPTATQIPAPYGGYAITMGNNVPMRSFADTNAMIVNILPENVIVQVIGQEYASGTAWHVVQYITQWGYIREDQLRMLNDLEVSGYLSSLRTPLPSPATSPTPAPITPDSPSSYGYVNTDKVRLRKGAGTDTAQIKMLNKYAFALVLGTQTGSDGKLWYKVSQAGTEGYIVSDFFKVLPLGGLTQFLQSPEYLSAGDDGNNAGSSTSNNITSIEDFNNGVWTNPNLVNASYEPFNPFAATTLAVEAINTPSLTPTAAVQPFPTGSEQPIPTFASFAPAVNDNNRGSGFLTTLIIGILLVAGGGGGIYAYMLHRSNLRRAAERASQRRQSQNMVQPGQNNRPTAPGTPPSPYAAPFMPPRGGAPQPPQGNPTAGSSTRVYPAVNPYAPPQTQQAKSYVPGQTAGKPYSSATQSYPSVQPPDAQTPPINPANSPEQVPDGERQARHRRSDRHTS